MMVVIIATILEQDRCMTCEEIAVESRIPTSSIHRVLTEVEGHCWPHDNARPRIAQTVKTAVITSARHCHTAYSPPDYKCKALSHCLQSSWLQVQGTVTLLTVLLITSARHCQTAYSPPDYKCKALSHYLQSSWLQVQGTVTLLIVLLITSARHCHTAYSPPDFSLCVANNCSL